MSFHVGQRVVCVDGRPIKIHYKNNVHCLVKGLVYTIAEVRFVDDEVTWKGSPYHGLVVLLREVEYPLLKEKPTGGFCVHRFRPLDERCLDIFREMLVTPPKETVSA